MFGLRKGLLWKTKLKENLKISDELLEDVSGGYTTGRDMCDCCKRTVIRNSLKFYKGQLLCITCMTKVEKK